MKAVKKTILIHNMLLLLTENEYISVSRMASILGVSESTIRRSAEALAGAVEESGYGTLLKVPGKGLHLALKDRKEGLEELSRTFANHELKNLATDEQQLYRYLFFLLENDKEKLTLEQVSGEMYDSVPVVRKKLMVCGEWLSLFGLRLVVKRNYGIALEGDEGNIRLAICHIVLHNDLYDLNEGLRVFCPGTDLEAISHCVSAMENGWNFKFTEESFHSILVYAALSVARRRRKLKLSETECRTVIQYNEYNWAQSLFQMIDRKFGISTGEEEIAFLAVQLLCSGRLHDFSAEENNAYRYDEKMKGFIRKIISVISEVLNVDLNQDEELYYGLLNHIRPAIFRMRFEKHGTKPLTDFIKEEYKDTFRVSWTLSILFEEYYGINISSTELSYITLYIQSALERVAGPVRLALVTELGMGLNQMFCNKIRQTIPRVESIAILSVHEFRSEILGQYDLIVTTSDLGISSEKLVQIGALLNDSGVAQINARLRQLGKRKLDGRRRFDVSCHSLFDPKLIFRDVAVQDKRELIEMLSQALTSMGYVTEKYGATIFKREKTVSTYIGNGVAIPHGNSAYVNDSKVAIAFLREGIIWNEKESEKVDTVFLLAFRIENQDNSRRVQQFYKVFLELIDTDESIRYLKSLSAEELYKYLVQ